MYNIVIFNVHKMQSALTLLENCMDGWEVLTNYKVRACVNMQFLLVS